MVMDEYKVLLSEKRLAKNNNFSKGDNFLCHLYNSELAESFYQSLSYFEIILRNKIDIVFSKSSIIGETSTEAKLVCLLPFALKGEIRTNL